MKINYRSTWHSIFCQCFLVQVLIIGGIVLNSCGSGQQHTITTTENISSKYKFPFGNGVNLQPSYYSNGNVNFAWTLMQQYPNITTVRFEIDPRRSNIDPGQWIHEAKMHGYNVICTYHTVLGSDNVNDLLDAALWWQQNYPVLSKYGKFTINLMNEWGSHTINATDFALAYNSAIDIVRTVYSGPIIIDLPGYGQETLTAAEAITGFGTQNGVKIQDPNIILSMHVYPDSYNDGRKHFLKYEDLFDIIATGKPAMFGEFADLSSTGPVDVLGIVNIAKQYGWPVLAWAWNGDGGLGLYNMVSPMWITSANAPDAELSLLPYFYNIYDYLGE